ncbi:MAG: acetyltransferase [Actinobacteria bacterium]|nr:acetyltransferase [Actinomycetota bacterium]
MRVIVIGAGGHAKVVIDAIERSGDEVVAVIDETARTKSLLGYEVSTRVPSDADGFVIAIGDNAMRMARFEHYLATGLRAVPVVHPSAIVADDVHLGDGTVVFAGVIVNRGTTVGENVILNTGCRIDHDCRIGDHAHIAPGVSLSGGVAVSEGALVGVGACAIPGTSIGSWATVGAGAAVVDPVPDGVTAVGAPARERHAT